MANGLFDLEMLCLFLSKAALQPASIHLELGSSVDQQASINTKVLYLEPRDLCLCLCLFYLLNTISTLSRWGSQRRGLLKCSKLLGLACPDIGQLILVKKVDAGSVASDVKVFVQIATLAEPDLGKISSSIISEADQAARLEDSVDVAHGLWPLVGREGREDENQHGDVYGAFLESRR